MSIVVPVYNVATYLPACLDSVLGQSYRRLQVIAVDDGSPDDSIDILRRYAAADRRLTVLRQANAGLGAARNVGAARARGRYLMFLDSDDVLLPDAVATFVETLERTGSDFAVSLYQRLDDVGTKPAAPWVRAAHRRPRLRSTLRDIPEVQVNAVAWSKCYRRQFWVDQRLRFPEGVLYEDQAVSARVYARSKSFDVLAAVTHNWRIRADWSSITQQMQTVADLRGRLQAAADGLAELRLAGAEEAHDARLAQLLSNDFPFSLKAAQHADDEFWTALRAGLADLIGRGGANVWAQVPAQHRVGYELVLRDLRDDLVEFVGLGHDNPKNFPAHIADGEVYVQFAAREALGLPADDPRLALTADQRRVVANLRRVAWRTDGALELTGWAYLDNVAMAAADSQVRVWLAHPSEPDRPVLELPTSRHRDPEVSAATRHRYADYEAGGFTTVLDPARLPADLPRDTEARLAVQIEVSAQGLAGTGPVSGLHRAVRGARLVARTSADGRQVHPSFDAAHGLVLTVTRPAVRGRTAEVDSRRLRLVLDRTGCAVARVTAHGETSGQKVSASVSRHQTTSLELPTPDPSVAGERETWLVRADIADGRRVPVALGELPDALTDGAGTSPGRLRARLTSAGNLGLADEPARVVVQTVTAGPGPTLRLAGRLRAESPLELRLTAPSGGTATTPQVDGDGRFTADLELCADTWNLGSRPLRSGTYSFTANLLPDGQPVPLEPSTELLTALPLPLSAGPVRAELWARGSGLALHVAPPLSDAERGARRQQALQDALVARFDDGCYEPGAVLFCSYFGEVCGCNPLAVHQELRRRGTHHTLYWAVRDHSVVVPEGGIPVIYESAEWYRLLHEAQYYLDNMHQPIYHRKPPTQVQVQFFHGYPFKEMGRSHWLRQHRDVAHVRSYLERAADWDYLVSPARYGTEALRREFGFPGQPLEIGYPRNDVLVSPQADVIRTQVRSRLGIASGQTAVLYAPTFRDELSRDDRTAAMVDFLDVDALAAALGPTYVVLVRGHAFNARQQARVGSRDNVVDVTDYPDIAGLCLASDAAVLDYSSLRFDYGLTGKPMVFMVPDLQRYLGQSRGSLLPFGPTAPGPHVATTSEVAEALRDRAGVRAGWADAYARFRADYLDLDDGHASARLVDAVFGPTEHGCRGH